VKQVILSSIAFTGMLRLGRTMRALALKIVFFRRDDKEKCGPHAVDVKGVSRCYSACCIVLPSAEGSLPPTLILGVIYGSGKPGKGTVG
jgi:hypothetical protein